MTLMEDKRLAGGGAGGVATVWDLATQHKTQGFTRTDHKVEKSVILGLSPSPNNENILMTSLSSVSVHLVRFRPPGHRMMIGGMEPMWGHLVTWRLWPRTGHQTV